MAASPMRADPPTPGPLDGTQQAPEERAAERKREEAANTYDTFDMRVDRHWTDKKVRWASSNQPDP